MKTIHPGHLEHRFCIFGCQILCITDLAIMPHWSSGKRSFKCSNHQPIVLCHSCAAVCHQSSGVDSFTFFRYTLYFIIWMLFPYNPCSCPAPGQCQLERTSLTSRISLSRICVVVTPVVFVIVRSITRGPDISYFVLVCLAVLSILIISIFKLCRPAKYSRSPCSLPSVL